MARTDPTLLLGAAVGGYFAAKQGWLGTEAKRFVEGLFRGGPLGLGSTVNPDGSNRDPREPIVLTIESPAPGAFLPMGVPLSVRGLANDTRETTKLGIDHVEVSVDGVGATRAVVSGHFYNAVVYTLSTLGAATGPHNLIVKATSAIDGRTVTTGQVFYHGHK